MQSPSGALFNLAAALPIMLTTLLPPPPKARLATWQLLFLLTRMLALSILLPMRLASVASLPLCPSYGLEMCAGHGKCVNGACECEDNRAGADCAVVLSCDPDATRLPCSGRGACRDDVCYCAPGYAGQICERDLWCPTDKVGRACSSVGICASHSCHCPSHRSGVACEIGDTSSRSVPAAP